MDVRARVQATPRAARDAARVLALCPTKIKNDALAQMAHGLVEKCPALLEANRVDVERARTRGAARAFLDRLTLTETRIEEMAQGLREIAALPDPVGTVVEAWGRPSGIEITRVRVPLGVVGFIYESRPNVTADAAALALKSGNAAILRGGSESHRSNRAVHAALAAALRKAKLPEATIELVPTRERAAVGMMLAGLDGAIDVIVPRGGKSLVARVQEEARVPVFAHLEGICHTFVDRSADLAMAKAIAVNGKMRRTGVCGATETLLVDTEAPAGYLAALVDALIAAGCEVRGDRLTQKADARVEPATEQDWSTEYLDAIISVKTVDGVDGAIAHIQKYGSQHT